MFVVFINDLDLVRETLVCTVSKFADDTKVLKEVNSDEEKAEMQCIINIIKKHYKPQNRTKATFLGLYVLPHLENFQAAWAPWLIGERKFLEDVHKRAFKQVNYFKAKDYHAQLITKCFVFLNTFFMFCTTVPFAPHYQCSLISSLWFKFLTI